MSVQQRGGWLASVGRLNKRIVVFLARLVVWVVICVGVLAISSAVARLAGASGQELAVRKLETAAMIGWFLVAACVLVGIQFIRQQVQIRRKRLIVVVQRPNPWMMLLFQLIMAVGFWFLLRDDRVVQEAFGFKQQWPLVGSIAVGLVAYPVVFALYEIGCRLDGNRQALQREELRAIRMVWPRRRREWVPFLPALCLLNPFTEEILFRAILVPLLIEASGGLIPGCALALLCSICMHLYQGWRLIPFHLLFHGTAIALVLSPAGIIGAIALHVVGDAWPLYAGSLLMRRRLAILRTRHEPETAGRNG